MKQRTIALCALAVVCALAGAACSSGPRTRHLSNAERARFLSQHHLDKLPASDVPLEVNERVIAWMDYFSGPGASHFGRYLSRSTRYIPMMKLILKKQGLPQDLVYVALIESGFNCNAQSHAAAVGPWQFIRGTGKRYGLRIDAWVDERRDPVKSTYAAARYLKDLYNEFGHWYLAMAGYNAGEGRVRKAVNASGSKNFWVHADPDQKYLMAETRDYVPKYIAANIMAKMPKEFGFSTIEYWTPLEYDIVAIPTQTDLEVAADCAGVKRSELEELNPELKIGTTPPGVANYDLRIPKGKKEKFLVAYAKIPENERIKIVMHRVERRESLASIAKRYGVSTRALANANGIGRRSKVTPGTQLVIPVGAGWQERVARLDAEERSVRRGKATTYKVRRGDTLGGIARKYNVTIAQLKSWNRLSHKGTIRVGQQLKIRGVTIVSDEGGGGAADGGGTYTVRRGDTPGTIAKKNGIKLSQLTAWNDLNPASPVVRVGQKLKVRPAAERSVPDRASSAPTSSDSAASTGGSTTHILASGETLGHVATAYGVSTKDLMSWNNISDPRRVRAGQRLVIRAPSKRVVTTAAASSPATQATHPAGPRQTAELAMAPTDALDVIETNEASAAETQSSSSPEDSTSAGAPATEKESPTPATATEAASTPVGEKQVKGATKSTTTYKIKSGDSLWSIAQKHGVSVEDIRKWNGINKNAKIRPGESIVIKKK